MSSRADRAAERVRKRERLRDARLRDAERRKKLRDAGQQRRTEKRERLHRAGIVVRRSIAQLSAAEDSPQLQHLVTPFLVECQKSGDTLQTARSYGSDLRLLLTFARSVLYHEPRVRDLTPDMLREFAKERSNGNIAHATVARTVSAVRSFLLYLHELGHVPASLEEALPPLAWPELPLSANSPDDLDDLLERLRTETPDTDSVGLRILATVELLFSSGIRVGELVGITRERLAVERRSLLVGKGRRERTVPVSAHALDSLVRFWRAMGEEPDPGEPILWTARGSISSRTLERDVSGALAKLGPGAHTSSESLRHSFAIRLRDGGADFRTLQVLLGHTNVRSTHRHLRRRRATPGTQG